MYIFLLEKVRVRLDFRFCLFVFFLVIFYAAVRWTNERADFSHGVSLSRRSDWNSDFLDSISNSLDSPLVYVVPPGGKNVSDRKYLRGTKATLEFARYFINFLEFSAVFSLFILQKVTHTHNFLFYFSWVNTRPSFRKRSKRPSDFSLSLVFLSSPRSAFFSPFLPTYPFCTALFLSVFVPSGWRAHRLLRKRFDRFASERKHQTKYKRKNEANVWSRGARETGSSYREKKICNGGVDDHKTENRVYVSSVFVSDACVCCVRVLWVHTYRVIRLNK